MTEDLVGYLLGALDGPEQEEIGQRLSRDDELNHALAALEERLRPLENLRWQEPVPDHLTARTCAFVAARAEFPSPRVFAPERDGRDEHFSASSRWNWVDVVVAATVLLAMGGLLSPAIYRERQAARVATCANHLRQLGVALPAWAERLNGWLPHIPTVGNTGVAGFYAPQLAEAGLLPSDHVLLCPDGPLAKERNRFRIPSVVEVMMAKGAELVSLQQQMGGSYNYGLGYIANGRHWGRQLAGRSHVAMMADRPAGGNGRHTGNGVNVLFEDGHVSYATLQTAGDSLANRARDWRDLFVNDAGVVEAGVKREDVVLAPSWVRPVPLHVTHLLLSTPSDPRLELMLQTIDGRALDTGSVLHGRTNTTMIPWYLVH